MMKTAFLPCRPSLVHCFCTFDQWPQTVDIPTPQTSAHRPSAAWLCFCVLHLGLISKLQFCLMSFMPNLCTLKRSSLRLPPDNPEVLLKLKNTNFSLSAAIDLLPGWVWANRLRKQPASICFVGLSLGPVLKNVFRFLCGFGVCEGSWTWLSTFYAKIFVCRKIYICICRARAADRVCL